MRVCVCVCVRACVCACVCGSVSERVVRGERIRRCEGMSRARRDIKEEAQAGERVVSGIVRE